jgi:hypothetical protein
VRRSSHEASFICCLIISSFSSLIHALLDLIGLLSLWGLHLLWVLVTLSLSCSGVIITLWVVLPSGYFLTSQSSTSLFFYIFFLVPMLFTSRSLFIFLTLVSVPFCLSLSQGCFVSVKTLLYPSVFIYLLIPERISYLKLIKHHSTLLYSYIF